MPPPLLQEVPSAVDEGNVGVSYSAVGPLLLIELGIAQAFIDLGIIPVAIAGTSAGAIAGTAHAYDPVRGSGIQAVAKALPLLSDQTLGLARGEMAVRLLAALLSMQRLPLGLADNGLIQPLIEGVLQELAGLPRLTIGDFGNNGRVRLFIGATDRMRGGRFWFPQSVEVADALVASSAIPGVFAPRSIVVDGQAMLFVDGALAQTQPLSMLALEAKCGSIYACAVNYDSESFPVAADAIDNIQTSMALLAHESSRLEQGYLELEFQGAGKGVVHHIHPEGPFGVTNFNFTSDQVQSVMALACQQTKDWLQAQGWTPHVGEARPIPVELVGGAPPIPASPHPPARPQGRKRLP